MVNPKVKYYSLLLLFPLFFVGWYWFSARENKPLRQLPFFDPKYQKRTDANVHHRVPAFSFTDQYGQILNADSLNNDVYISEFFFTTCQSICPVMNTNLKRVYSLFGQRQGFRIVSHTVDPETDSVPVLHEYAERHGVSNRKWLFVTGTKKELYQMARKGYLLDDGSGEGNEEDFVHTQNFALVDREKHIRGLYDGTDSLEIKRMIADITVLLEEYDYKTRHKP